MIPWDWAGEFLRRDCREAREALRADFAHGGVLRLASKSLVKALTKLSAQVLLKYYHGSNGRCSKKIGSSAAPDY